MKLEFDIELKNKHWVVTVYVLEEIFGDKQLFREPLNEAQYAQMADWCQTVFQTDRRPNRAKRSSYDSFQFKSKRDLDWFILHWSSVDILFN